MAIIDVIKYEGDNSTLVFKHNKEDFNHGSQLIVHESQEAIFFKNGIAMDRFGAGRYTLDTESLPLMKSYFNKISSGESQFHAEIYFINLASIMGIRWGTDSKIRMYDPASGLHLEIGAFGEFNLRISDSSKLLLKLVGTELNLKREDILGGSAYSSSSVSGKFKGLVMTKVKSFLPKAIRENNIDILEIDEHLDEIGEYIRKHLNEQFESYGLTISEFFVQGISTPDDDVNFKRLKQQHAERFLKIQEERIKKEEAEVRKDRVLIEAETEAEVKLVNVKVEEEKTKRMAYAEAEKLRAEGYAKADVMRAQGFNYQQETQRDIGVSLAKNEGNGATSAVSSLVQAGIGLGAMAAISKETIHTMNGVMDNSSYSWTCSKCGFTLNKGKFCQECGEKKVEIIESWKCNVCGYEGNTSKFCQECGAKRG